MRSPVGKPALDAITDQSLAEVRDHRDGVRPAVAAAAADMAALLAEQFPAAPGTAGRVTMAVAQAIAAMTWRPAIPGQDAVTGDLTDVLALAAEQLTREASDG